MEEAVTILDVLAVDLCALQILDYVPLRDLMRSERVSRQLQQTVHKYIRSTDLTLLDSPVDPFELTESYHRTIKIPRNLYSLSCLHKTVEKLGASIVKVITNKYSNLYFQFISSVCPDLQHIQFCNMNGQTFPMNTIKNFEKLNQISFYFVHEMSEHALGLLLQKVNCKKLEIYEKHHPISFRFLTFIEPFSLTSLSLKYCIFSMTDLASQICYLQNITSLEMEINRMAVFEDIHKLLNGLPKLKTLSLTRHEYTELGAELIESFSQLVNLKRLVMSHNRSVSNPLLEAVARGSKKLEYLDVRSSIKMEARTLAALCTIPSPLVIAFSFPYVYEHLYYSSAEDFNKLVAEAKKVPFFRELEDLGLKLMWSDVVGVVSRVRATTTQLKLGCIGSEAGSFQHELRLYL